MKKFNFWLAAIAAIVFFFGNYFKVQHWPGASVLMIIGALAGIVFLFMYLFGDVANLNEGKERTNGVLGAITMILVLIGFTFKIMHWPGANIGVYFGHAVLLLFSIYLFIDASNETDANKQTIKVFNALTIVVLMSILVLFGLGSVMG
ncbi:MAG: hypothetical protein GXO79_11755 [Chlorobi bacterium]|nr:hypothetical protein [Chlorobiota bacterium]